MTETAYFCSECKKKKRIKREGLEFGDEVWVAWDD